MTASAQIKMLEQNLRKRVEESYKTEIEERKQVKESLIKDIKKAAQRKD